MPPKCEMYVCTVDNVGRTKSPSPQRGLRLHEGLLPETSGEVPHTPARGRPPSARKRDTVTLHPSHLYVPILRGSRGRPPLPSPYFYYDFARCLLHAWHGLHQILYAYSPMSAHVFLFSVAINASNLLKWFLENTSVRRLPLYVSKTIYDTI